MRVVERYNCHITVFLLGTIMVTIPTFLGVTFGLGLGTSFFAKGGPGVTTKGPRVKRLNLPTIGGLLLGCTYLVTS